jgi:hypothetical protein
MTYLAHSFLISFPLIVSIWSGIAVVWGIAVGLWMKRIMTHTSSHRIDDLNYQRCVWAGNALIFTLSFIIPWTAPSMWLAYGDSIIVLNIFYTAFLAVSTFGLIKWSKALVIPTTQPPVPQQP